MCFYNKLTYLLTYLFSLPDLLNKPRHPLQWQMLWAANNVQCTHLDVCYNWPFNCAPSREGIRNPI